MAKKRKGAGSTKKAARSVKKKAVKKAAPRTAAAKPPTGLEDPNKVDLVHLKALMGKHIARFEAAPVKSDKVLNALRILTQARAELTNECQPTMVIPTS